MAPACWCCGGSIQKRDNSFCLLFYLGESCLPALALMPDTSIPPVCHLHISSCYLSAGAQRERVWESWCVGSLSGFFGATEVSSTNSTPAGFCSQNLWGLTFLACGPWPLRPGVGLRLHAPEIFLPNFYPPPMDVGPVYSTSLILLPVWMGVVSLIL